MGVLKRGSKMFLKNLLQRRLDVYGRAIIGCTTTEERGVSKMKGSILSNETYEREYVGRG